LSSRAFYIVFSIFASVALWMYVEYVENPDTPSGRISVPVEFLNRELVTDRQLVITETSSEEVTLQFEGKRGVVTALNKGGAVRVTVDLAQIKGQGSSKLAYDVVYGEDISASGLDVIYRSEDYITVNVEAVSRREVPLSGSYTAGNIAMEGYQAEQMRFESETVAVSGPESVVSRIEKAMVYIQRENLTKTVTEDAAFTLLDADGGVIPTDRLTFSRDTVTVTIPILMVKDVPLKVYTINGAGATTENTSITIEPEFVTLAGEPDVFDGMNNIEIAAIDTTKFESGYEKKYQIIIPNGTRNLTGTTEATVTVTIAGLETVHLSATRIQATNVTEGYAATIITQSLDVVIRGRAENLAGLTAENVHIVADLTDYGDTSGTYTVPARVIVDGDFGGVGAVTVGSEYRVTVTLTAVT
jgi:YbbR domain-containing protein